MLPGAQPAIEEIAFDIFWVFIITEKVCTINWFEVYFPYTPPCGRFAI